MNSASFSVLMTSSLCTCRSVAQQPCVVYVTYISFDADMYYNARTRIVRHHLHTKNPVVTSILSHDIRESYVWSDVCTSKPASPSDRCTPLHTAAPGMIPSILEQRSCTKWLRLSCRDCDSHSYLNDQLWLKSLLRFSAGSGSVLLGNAIQVWPNGTSIILCCSDNLT